MLLAEPMLPSSVRSRSKSACSATMKPRCGHTSTTIKRQLTNSWSSSFNTRTIKNRATTSRRSRRQAARPSASNSWPPRNRFRRRGAALLREDPKTQGEKLFTKHCASCHDYVDPAGKDQVQIVQARLQRPVVNESDDPNAKPAVVRDAQGKVKFQPSPRTELVQLRFATMDRRPVGPQPDQQVGDEGPHAAGGCKRGRPDEICS